MLHKVCAVVATIGLAAAPLRAEDVNITLTVAPLRFVGGPGNPINFTTRAYNNGFPGPKITVKQGDRLRITLINAIPGASDDVPAEPNTFGNSNTTNLHLHGLHVSPENSSDNVFRAVAPGQTAVYEYHIPPDHPCGTFWYHPHYRGSSALQQGGGMAGALIVEPSDPATYMPPDLAVMGEGEVLVLQHLCFYTDGVYRNPNPYINHMMVSKYAGDMLRPDPSFLYNPNNTNGYVLMNGVYQPTLATVMQPAEYKLFRFVGASVSTYIALGVVEHTPVRSTTSTSNNSLRRRNGPLTASATSTSNAARGGDPNRPPCDVYVIAKDGIYLERPLPNQRPLLGPGSRIDVAVRCTAAGSYDIVSHPDAPYQADFEPNTNIYDGVLATFVVSGSQKPTRLPATLPERPSYMPDFTGGGPAPPDQQFNVVFYTPGGPFSYGPPYPPYQINQQSFSTKDNFVRNITLGIMEEWQVQIDGDETDSSNHPFHMHVNPFQVVGIGYNNASALDINVGEWRDTLPIPGAEAPSGASLTIRFRPDAYTGHALFHCHMVPHADLGMAAVVHIAAPHTSPARARARAQDLAPQQQLPLQTLEPRHPLTQSPKQCVLTAYGGSTASEDNAGAIRKALADCSGTGGGTVVVAGGDYKTGPVVVSGSGVSLEVQAGATLSTAYGPDGWPHSKTNYVDILTFTKCHGCTLTGGGTITGRGGRPPLGDDWYYLFDQKKLQYERPHLLVVSDCNDFTLSGSLTILDAPFFNVALNNVQRGEITGLNITSTWYKDPKTGKLMEPHNTDGIDPGSGSSDIWIHHVHISNGDDSVAIKPSTPCTRNILVEDSTFEHGHGCSIGSVGHGCVENVVFRNIKMTSQECGCRVKSYSSTEGNGRVHNISWINITMQDVDSCVSVNDQYKAAPPNAKYFVNVSNLLFKNVVGKGCKESGGGLATFVCPHQAPCSGIEIDNLNLHGGASTNAAGAGSGGMVCTNAYGFAKDGSIPASCLSGNGPPSPNPAPPSPPPQPSPSPPPSPPPSPSPSPPPSPPPNPPPGPPSPPYPPNPVDCDVDGCFERCVAKYGGTIATASYACAKGCAGMKHQKVAEMKLYCKMRTSKRYSTCFEKNCKKSSSSPASVAECQYGCGWWEDSKAGVGVEL